VAVSFLKAIAERVRRFNILWAFWVAVSLIAALHYNQYRNRPVPVPPKKPRPSFTMQRGPELLIRNPWQLKDAAAMKLGEIAKQVSATEMFEDFRRDERKARDEYVGKTCLIEGAVFERFELHPAEVEEVSVLRGPPDFGESVTVGLMLLPETPEMLQVVGVANTDGLQPVTVETPFKPREYINLYQDALKAADPSFDPAASYVDVYSSYSDDFSFRSRTGGIYCMFANPDHTVPYLKGESPRRRVTAECKIIAYKPGGSEKIDRYKLAAKESSTIATKPRVLAVGCKEINYVVD